MLHTLLALSLLASPEIYGDNLLYPDQEDFVSGSGVAAGLFGLQICTQAQNDTTPGVGFGYGPLGLGCNFLILADNNTGPISITTFDGVPPSVPGTPGSILYVVGPATAANPSTIADSGNFELEYAWSAAGSGQETRLLVLECIAADTFVEVTRHNGIRYFDDKIFVEAGNITDFANAQAVVGHSDSGQTSDTDRIGVVGEAASDGSNESRGVAGYAKTSSAEDATGVLGIAFVNAGSDTKTAYGGIFAASDTHGSGPNVGAFCTASGGLTNYCLQLSAGDINSLAAINWLMLDATVASVSWDAAGAANILSISSADGEETVSHVSKFTGSSALDAATGDEYAWDLAYETNKATSGDSYGLRIIHTPTGVIANAYMLSITGTGSLVLDNAGDLTLDSGAAVTHTTTFAYNTAARGEILATATDLEVKGDGVIPLKLHSEALSSAASTANVTLYSGAASNSGDFDSGDLDLYTGTTTALGDSGGVILRSGNAADSSGNASVYSGSSANTGGVTGDVALVSGGQSHATGGSSGDVDIYTGTAAGTAATGAVGISTGNQSNVGDYASGDIDIQTGTATATLGDSGAVAIRSGNAADTSGAVDLYSGTSANTGEASGGASLSSGNQTHATGSGSGAVLVRSGTAAGTGITGGVTAYTGAQSNTGDVDSGDVTVYTGATTTDGDTGDIILRTGAAGAGATDAGSIVLQTHGTNARLTIDGAGLATFTGTVDHSDQNITSVGDIELDSLTAEATSGGITIGGTGATSTESLLWRFGETDNQVDVTSAVGVLTIEWGTLNHEAGAIGADGLVSARLGATVSGAALDVQGQMITEGDGTYSWDHTPTGIATEGTSEFDGMLWADGGATIAGLTMSGDLDMADYDILNPSQLYQEAITADTTPGDDLDILAGNAYSEATGGNQVGGSANVAAGIGTRQVTIDDFNNCALDTVTSTNDGVDCVCTEADGGGANKWDAVTDNATSATNLAVCLDACPGASASATAAVVYIVPDPDDTFSVALAEGDATCTTLTQGTDGSVVLHTGHAALTVGPALSTFTTAYTGAKTSTTLGAAATTFAAITNFHEITGDGGANTLATITGGAEGMEFRMTFVDALVTITGTDAHTANTVDLDSAFTSADDVTLTLIYDGTSWYETGRSTSFTGDLLGAILSDSSDNEVDFGDNIDMNGYLVGDSTDAVEIGSACTGGVANSDFCSGGTFYADNATTSIVFNGAIQAAIANGPDIVDEASTATNPVFLPGGDVTMGIGSDLNGVTLVANSHAILNARIKDTLSNGDIIYIQSGTYINGSTTDATLSATALLNATEAPGGTDNYSAINVDIATTNTTGWDEVNLLRLQEDSTDRFRVSMIGDVTAEGGYAGTYGTFALGAAEKFFIDAATTEHTQTAGALDIDLIPTTDATGVVAADIHITAPALGIEATTHYGLNVQYTGDAQDEGASIVQLIQVGFTPNTSGATVYGMYSADNDLDYFIFNDGTAESRFDGEVHFANNAAAATFGLVTTDADVVLAFDEDTNQGSITYMGTTDLFSFDNDVDVIGDLTANTIVSDGALSGTALTTDGLRVKAASGDTALAGAASLTVTDEIMRVVGDAGAQVLGDPNIVSPASDGTHVCMQGTSDANTVTIQDESVNDGSEMELSGDVSFTLGENDIWCGVYDSGEDRWIEMYRSDNTDAE